MGDHAEDDVITKHFEILATDGTTTESSIGLPLNGNFELCHAILRATGNSGSMYGEIHVKRFINTQSTLNYIGMLVDGRVQLSTISGVAVQNSFLIWNGRHPIDPNGQTRLNAVIVNYTGADELIALDYSIRRIR